MEIKTCGFSADNQRDEEKSSADPADSVPCASPCSPGLRVVRTRLRGYRRGHPFRSPGRQGREDPPLRHRLPRETPGIRPPGPRVYIGFRFRQGSGGPPRGHGIATAGSSPGFMWAAVASTKSSSRRVSHGTSSDTPATGTWPRLKCRPALPGSGSGVTRIQSLPGSSGRPATANGPSSSQPPHPPERIDNTRNTSLYFHQNQHERNSHADKRRQRWLFSPSLSF